MTERQMSKKTSNASELIRSWYERLVFVTLDERTQVAENFTDWFVFNAQLEPDHLEEFCSVLMHGTALDLMTLLSRVKDPIGELDEQFTISLLPEDDEDNPEGEMPVGFTIIDDDAA